MVLPQLLYGRLLPRVVLCAHNLLHPPFVTGGGAEHAPHQVPAAVCMGKGVQGIVSVHPEFSGGDKNSAAGAQGDIALPLSHRACAHRGGGIVPGSRRHQDALRNSQLRRSLGQHPAHRLKALKTPGQLLLPDAADLTHLPGPPAVLHVKQKHAGGV